MRAAIAWVGCRVNQYEASALAEALRADGWEVVPFDQEADLYLINACAVTERALADIPLLARANLVHRHQHRHGALAHRHDHVHDWE